MRIENFSLSNVSSSPGVYMMKDQYETIIYVGKAKNLRKRLSSYFNTHNLATQRRIQFLMQKVCFIETILVSNETEALLLENNLIKQYQPKYNILLKDDKTFSCLAISLTHPWPKITMLRTKEIASSKKQLIFGPYVNSEACKALLEIISQSFPLRTCSNQEFATRKRPCILYDMRRCLAPCVGLCSQEEYSQMIEKVVLFLKGNIQEIIDKLKQSIQQAAQEQKFEQAAIYHRMLRLMQQAMEKQNVEHFHFHNTDVIGLYRNNTDAVITILTMRSGKLLGARHFPITENAQEDEDLLSSFILQYYIHKSHLPKNIFVPISIQKEAISHALHASTPLIRYPKTGYGKELINLANDNAKDYALIKQKHSRTPVEDMNSLLQIPLALPYRIECYDNAHLQGSHEIGGFIVFENDNFVKKDYRHFHIHAGGNDLAAFDEVLSKRFQDHKQPLPNLIVIDGGQTHYSFVQKKLAALQCSHIHIVAISKDHGNHSRALQQEKIFCTAYPKGLQLPSTSKLLQFFQMLRDEAHSFVIHRYRKKHSSTVLSFDNKISGIGPIKQKRLLQAFKSWQKVLTATETELQQVKGLTKKDIQAILDKQKGM